MRNTNNKKEYRRLLAILLKAEGRTFEDIANEHGVSSRSVQRWVTAYIQNGIDGVKMKKPGGSKSGITDEDKEIILSAGHTNLARENISTLGSQYPFHELNLDDCLSKIHIPNVDKYKDHLFILLNFPVNMREEKHEYDIP